MIEFNGELIIDPAYLHTFELDPRMFGPQGIADSLEAAEDVEFTKVLRNVANYTSKKSRKKANDANSVLEPTPVSEQPQESDMNAVRSSELSSAENAVQSAVTNENIAPAISTASGLGNDPQHAETSFEIGQLRTL